MAPCMILKHDSSTRLGVCGPLGNSHLKLNTIRTTNSANPISMLSPLSILFSRKVLLNNEVSVM